MKNVILTKNRLKQLAGLLKEEADIIDFSSFKKRKNISSFMETALVSLDGSFVLNPKDYRFVIMTDEEQKQAILEGDVKTAKQLGAQFYEIKSGDEVDIVNEQKSPEFAQDLAAYIKNINFNDQKSSKIGSNDSVDGPYTKLSNLQPFDENKIASNNCSREMCKLCYEPNAMGFCVPDDVWILVAPKPILDQNETICLSCFIKLADEKLVQWDKDIIFYPVSKYTHIY